MSIKTTFIIRNTSEIKNLTGILDYLSTVLNVKVILISNTVPESYIAKNLECIFVQNSSLTKLINLALYKVTTPVVALCDTSLITLAAHSNAEDIILRGEVEIVYPFDKINVTEQKIDYNNLEVGIPQEGNIFAHCIYLNTEIYKKNGGENEDLLGDRYHDDERYLRFKKLGYKIDRLNNKLLHLGNLDNESRFLGDYKTSDRDLYIKLDQMDLQKYKFYCLFHGKAFYPSQVHDNYLVPHLVGGLGNRLFQIASIYGLAKKLGKNFAISIDYKDGNKHSEINYYDTIFKTLPKVGAIRAQVYTDSIDKYSTYSDIKLEEGNYIMQGYYQNEKFFRSYRDDVLKLFNFDSVERKYENLDTSMFIHLRYFSPSDGGMHHDINMSKYLNNVIADLGEKIRHIHFYILSNDLKAVLQRYNLLKFQNKTIIHDCNELEALSLMSQCKLGGICVNSSLGWWGAYLNPNPNKKVYFPNKYIKNDWPCDIATPEMTVLPV
jgi:hypothetical protein